MRQSVIKDHSLTYFSHPDSGKQHSAVARAAFSLLWLRHLLFSNIYIALDIL